MNRTGHINSYTPEQQREYLVREITSSTDDHQHDSGIVYEIATNIHGDFAGRRLDTGFIIAGFIHAMPSLSIEEAAENIFRQQSLSYVHLCSDFTIVMLRLIQEYFERQRQKYGSFNQQSPTRFPSDRVRPDPVSGEPARSSPVCSPDCEGFSPTCFVFREQRMAISPLR